MKRLDRDLSQFEGVAFWSGIIIIVALILLCFGHWLIAIVMVGLLMSFLCNLM